MGGLNYSALFQHLLLRQLLIASFSGVQHRAVALVQSVNPPEANVCLYKFDSTSQHVRPINLRTQTLELHEKMSKVVVPMWQIKMQGCPGRVNIICHHTCPYCDFGIIRVLTPKNMSPVSQMVAL